jgi:hypothetical protein
MPQTAEEVALDPVQFMSLTWGAFPRELPGPFPDTFEAGSSGETLRRLTYFTPAIPAESTWLEVCSESGIVRFDLLEGRGGEPKA